jgi:hypothetical protein
MRKSQKMALLRYGMRSLACFLRITEMAMNCAAQKQNARHEAGHQ